MYMKKNNILIIIVIILFIIGIIVYFKVKGENNMEYIDGGVVKNRRLEGYNEDIKSKEIIKFAYKNGEFDVFCELKDNVLHVKSTGGNYSNRDNSYFKLDYNAKDNSLLNKLQDIIDKYQISKNNGYEYEVSGLPEGYGDTINVLYKSNEKIYKYSNQSHNLNEESIKEIYNVFLECAKENDLDFTTSKSNINVYDDANIDYLQGTWIGTHFGNEYKVVFDKDNVKIYKNNELTDNTKYLIINGDIITDKVKKDVDNHKDRYDYEEFNSLSIMKKKNDFTIVAYFMKDSYSTCDLLKEK